MKAGQSETRRVLQYLPLFHSFRVRVRYRREHLIAFLEECPTGGGVPVTHPAGEAA